MSDGRKNQQPAAEPLQPTQREKRRNYDMDDSENDFKRWPKLAPVLQDCEAIVGAAYHTADAASIRHQARRWWLVLFAAVSGMFAVLFAIVQLYPQDRNSSV